VLHRLPPTGCESFIQGSSRVSAPPFCILLQLRTPFRLRWNHAHGCLAFLMLIARSSTALVKTYLPKFPPLNSRSRIIDHRYQSVIEELQSATAPNFPPLPSFSGIDPEPDEV